MVGNIDKLSSLFEQGEIETIKAENPTKYKALLEKIDLLTITQEEIAKLKSDLS
jgi:hypothetical protein